MKFFEIVDKAQGLLTPANAVKDGFTKHNNFVYSKAVDDGFIVLKYIPVNQEPLADGEEYVVDSKTKFRLHAFIECNSFDSATLNANYDGFAVHFDINGGATHCNEYINNIHIDNISDLI